MTISRSVQSLDVESLATGECRRLLIEGHAGFGKSFLLRRAAASLSQAFPTFFIPCSQIPTDSLDAEPGELLSQIVAEVLGPVTAHKFESLQSEGEVCLLVLDGLNEIAVEFAKVERLLKQARLAPDLLVLASRRPAITRNPPEGYVLGFLLPLRAEYVTNQFGKLQHEMLRLLRIPLFFQMRKEHGIEASNESDAIQEYLVQCLLGLAIFGHLRDSTAEHQHNQLKPALRSIGDAAVAMYEQLGSTAAAEEFFANHALLLEIGGVSAALECGFFVRDGNAVRFRHQLFHDWSIAFAYRNRNAVLDSTNARHELNVATLSRQSTDALGFLVQMHATSNQVNAEQVVLNIYDWDYPSAATTLLSWKRFAEANPELAPSRHIEIAIFSLIAEKRFDLFQHTVDRFESLRVSIDPLLIEHLGLSEGYSLIELEEAVATSDPGEDLPAWYLEWVHAFAGEMSFGDLLTQVEIGEDILGWTASNVLLRREMGDSELDLITAMFESLTTQTEVPMDHVQTVRWRLVHAVGRTPAAADFLAQVAGDESHESDVRYGAVRSLCALALISQANVVGQILQRLVDLDSQGYLEDPRVATAIRRCCIPAAGVRPRSVPAWREGFATMLGSHIQRLSSEGSQEELALWQERMENLEAWTASEESDGS